MRRVLQMTSLAAWLLTGCGVVVLSIGAFFLTARPPLLPEDLRFMGATAESITAALPALSRWLRRVFWVLGGFISTTGVLVIYVANTGIRSDGLNAVLVLGAAGITSLGWMTVVNFMLRSASRWGLVAVDGFWTISLVIAVTAR